ncbi:iron ABC transporter permease [Cereibacter changlensis JA139]|uniref:Iron ABC transporter permease n=2 Tax=Cereibacter changlensis TaxID=402884 RepID=A0A2T4JRJ9_9RHOB|nr:iron chelate uptake ABC transporter family permease subunit [Cereibacter changlensis]PTE20528.1 iron ABC transporter permease [Cereibacter changlensis JA139]PZX49466.1 iron complex transport system permease protein [Cereibacter changlensis]
MRVSSWVLLALAPLSLASLMTGAASLDPSSLGADPRAWMLLMESRLPRTLAVLLTGAALAVAGVVMQQLVRNRFVEPGTIGTAESAAIGLLAITLIAPASPVWVKMLAASLAAMAGTALFLALIRRLPPREVLLVPLVGLILSGVLQSAATFVAWQTDLMQYLGIWLMTGEFSGVVAGRYALLWIAGAATCLAWVAADRLALLGLGEQTVTGLGLNPVAVMRLGLLVVALVTAMVVVTVGMVPFVGLVVPNVVARLMGDNLRATLPVVAAVGAALVLACDLLGRLIRYPYELPVGTVLGVLGSLLFLWLLWRPQRA